MITDQETNFVYFSELLEGQYPHEYVQLTNILKKHQVNYGLLKETKDIWCRDYMPLQLEKNSFLQFAFDPSYLNDSDSNRKSKSIPKIVCPSNGIPPVYDEFKVEGGNVIRWHDRVIMTDRVFKENNIEKKKEKDFVNALSKKMNAEVFIIPSHNMDFTGHADGLVRFYDRDTILVNELKNEVKYWKEGIKRQAKEYALKMIEIPWFEDRVTKLEDSAIGIYMNFLHVSNLIIIPVFEIDGNRDNETYKLFKELFPKHQIETVQVNNIAVTGGILNCITWNIIK